MGIESKIEWTDATWNPWHGCIKVSPGCKNCYMYRDKSRFGKDPKKIEKSISRFEDPLRWRDPKKIFTCSWSDFFIYEADEWRSEAWDIIKNSPRHTFQILTKRPERIERCLPPDWGDGYKNVWLGVSVEGNDQDFRREILSSVPASVRFISYEPILERIINGGDFSKIDWAILGGESGPGARPCDPDWIDRLTLRLTLSDVPVFVKQLGTVAAKANRFKNKKGGDPDEWGDLVSLKKREFPQKEIKKNEKV